MQKFLVVVEQCQAIIRPDQPVEAGPTRAYTLQDFHPLRFRFGNRDSVVMTPFDGQLVPADLEPLQRAMLFNNSIRTKFVVNCPVSSNMSETRAITIENPSGVTPLDIFTTINKFYCSALTADDLKVLANCDWPDEDVVDRLRRNLEEKREVLWADLMEADLNFEQITYHGDDHYDLSLIFY
jgi:hypothetical protein